MPLRHPDSGERVGARRELAVTVRDRGGRMRRPADADSLVADRDLRMVIGGLGGLGEPVDEVDPLEVAVEAELTLERTVDLAPALEPVHEAQYGSTGSETGETLFERSLKQVPTTELVCRYGFRPLAHVLVLALRPLRVPPPAVVLAAAAVGMWAAIEIVRGHLVLAALLVVLKTLLDNADGQLARATGQVSALGRYLDSESDLLVNVALFAALGYVAGPFLALTAFLVLTLVLSVNFNLRRLYQNENGAAVDAMPAVGGVAVALQRMYGAVYAPQDRAVEAFVRRRLGRLRLDPDARRAYHDRETLVVLHNFGLSSQMAVLALCLVLGHPGLYLWLVLACGLTLVPLELRRERRAVMNAKDSRRWRWCA